MNKSIVIVTQDQRLAAVLAMEAAMCGASYEILQEIQGIDASAWESVRIAFVDLDSKLSGNIPEQVRVLGLCRDPEALPLKVRRMAHVLLGRPFLMADLRRELAEAVQGENVPAPLSNRQGTALQLQQDSRCVLMGNRQLSLTDKEFLVLSLLMQRGEQGVSKQELDVLLHAQKTNEGAVYVCRLRKKLEQAFDLQPIKTVRNHGYVYT